MTLEVKTVTVGFGGVVALKDVSLSVTPAAIAAVVGPNGSGKSTLFNAISGLVSTRTGTIGLDGKDLAGMTPQRRISAGIARTFQTPRFDPRVTVLETVKRGFYPKSRVSLIGVLLRSPATQAEEREITKGALAILADLGLARYADELMSSLPMGHVRLVEVARAIANEPAYILLDEPAAGLTRDERNVLAREIRRIAARGVGVLLVEHNFDLVRQLADEITVLNQGRMLLRGKPDDVAADRDFIAIYLGRGPSRKLAS